MKTKPVYGSPCNGCGLCCIAAQCPLSEALFGIQDRCPALQSDSLGGYGCGLLRDTASFARGDIPSLTEALAVMIGAGQGCDAVHNDEDRAAWIVKSPGLKAKLRAAVDRMSPKAREVLAAISGL